MTATCFGIAALSFVGQYFRSLWSVLMYRFWLIKDRQIIVQKNHTGYEKLLLAWGQGASVRFQPNIQMVKISSQYKISGNSLLYEGHYKYWYGLKKNGKICQEFPEKIVWYLIASGDMKKRRYDWSYKDTGTQLHGKQVLLIWFSSDSEDTPISGTHSLS